MNKPKVFLDGNFQIRHTRGIPHIGRIYRKYREKWNEYPKKFKVSYFPIHLDIELNTNCNLRCVGCFQSFDTPETVIMPFAMVKQIIDQGASHGLCSIKLNYRGEPLLYPNLVEVVKYAKSKGIIEVMFNTNGYLLNLDIAHKLMKAGLDLIIFSIDDHRAIEYSKYRVGSDLGVVENNIRNLNVMKAFHNFKTPRIRIQKIDRPETKHFNKEYLEKYRQYADFVAFHEFLDYRCKPTPTPMPEWCCASLWQRMLVLADGSIVACCGLNANFSRLGHIKENSIKSLWLGQLMNKFRKYHKQGLSHKIRACRNCALRLHYLNTP